MRPDPSPLSSFQSHCCSQSAFLQRLYLGSLLPRTSSPLARVRSNRIGASPIEVVAPSLNEVIRRRVYVADSDGSGKVAAVVGREEVCVLVTTSPGCNLEGSKAFWPGCTGVVPDVDILLDIAVAITTREGINDEGGSTGSETGHDDDGGGGRETHFG